MLTYTDVEAALVAYLAPLRVPVPVRTRVPDPIPPLLVQLRRVGGASAGPRSDAANRMRDRPRVDVFCWADVGQDQQAMQLALAVRSDMWALEGTDLLGVACYRVGEFLGPTRMDDQQTGRARVLATYELSLRVS